MLLNQTCVVPTMLTSEDDIHITANLSHAHTRSSTLKIPLSNNDGETPF